MLICYTSDLHGQPQLYDQLGELISAVQPQLLILGGDLLPDGEPSHPIETQAAAVDAFFLPRVEAFRRSVPELHVACLPGNHDWSTTVAHCARAAVAGPVALLNLQTPWRCGVVQLLGYHCTPWTPHWVKCFERRDLPEDPIPQSGGQIWDPSAGRIREIGADEHFGKQPTMADELALAASVVDPWIFACHAPPRDSGLDRLPQVPHPIGSVAVRRFIERRQPLVALHGHVHESVQVTGQFAVHIGRTLCVNPGQSDDRLHAVTFELDNPAETLKHTVYS